MATLADSFTIASAGARRYIWFKLSLILGAALGVLLLVQSIRTYVYVSRRLVEEELRRDAMKLAAELERQIRRTAPSGPSELASLLEEAWKGTEGRCRWVRIVNQRGEVLAQRGRPDGDLFTPEQVRDMFRQRKPLSIIRWTRDGQVLVTMSPLRVRLRYLRSENAQGIYPALEVSLYLESAAGAFGLLRQNLIINVLAALALLGSMALMGLRLGNYLRGKQLEQQLELARKVQQDLLPSPTAASGSLEFAGECIAAWQVGGDFYDVFCSDDDQVALVIGDVSGKGLPAALLMGLLHGAVRASTWFGTQAGHEAASSRINELLCARSSGERFASLFWCYYDPKSELLRYVNAGHLPPLLIQHDGARPDSALRLKEGGPVLGLVPSAEYRQGVVSFRPGDLLVLFSDGIVEATDTSGQEYGERRLYSVVRKNWGKSPAAIRNALLDDIRSFVGNEPLRDDLTLVVARVAITDGPLR